jgi:teichoic acid transport system ATP-binding protein
VNGSAAISARGLGIAFRRVVRSRTRLRHAFIEKLKTFRAGLRVSTNHHDLFWALRDVSFEVREGSKLGIIGRNGAGKSTLCHLLSGIYRPNEGYLHVNGKVSALLSLAGGMNEDLSGYENAMLYGVLLGIPPNRLRKLLPEIVAFSELEASIDQPVKHYSTGMKARLGFAVASAVEPEILLLDEVLTVGDTAFQRKCELRISELVKKAKAVVIASHDIPFVEKNCDSVLWLDGGRAAAFGPPPEVCRAYLGSLV